MKNGTTRIGAVGISLAWAALASANPHAAPVSGTSLVPYGHYQTQWRPYPIMIVPPEVRVIVPLEREKLPDPSPSKPKLPTMNPTPKPVVLPKTSDKVIEPNRLGPPTLSRENDPRNLAVPDPFPMPGHPRATPKDPPTINIPDIKPDPGLESVIIPAPRAEPRPIEPTIIVPAPRIPVPEMRIKTNDGWSEVPKEPIAAPKAPPLLDSFRRSN